MDNESGEPMELMEEFLRELPLQIYCCLQQAASVSAAIPAASTQTCIFSQ